MHLGSIFFWEFLGVKRIALNSNVDTRGVCNRISETIESEDVNKRGVTMVSE
jgi:hypothetical protein